MKPNITKSSALFATGFLALALTSGGVTTALWKKSAPLPASSIVNGDMSIKAGNVSFTKEQCYNPAITPQNPEKFKLTPGENGKWNQDITVNFTGDNAASDLELKWNKKPNIPKTWAGSYQVFKYDKDGNLSSTAEKLDYDNSHYQNYFTDQTSPNSSSYYGSTQENINNLIAAPMVKDLVVKIKDTPVNQETKYRIVFTVETGLSSNGLIVPAPYMIDYSGQQITKSESGVLVNTNIDDMISFYPPGPVNSLNFDKGDGSVSDNIDFTGLEVKLVQKREGAGFNDTSSASPSPSVEQLKKDKK